MSDIQFSETALPAKVCFDCGNPDIVKDVPNALCTECRNAAIKFPIPVWVKLFGGGILLLVLFSLINLPQSLTLGSNLEKGIAAEEQQKFVTAQRYFMQVIKLDSNNTEANEHLMVAAYYNYDLANFLKAGNRIGNKTLDEDDLLNKVNALADKTNFYFPSDSFYAIEQRYTSEEHIPDSVYINYINNNDENVFEETLYASVLFDRKDYHRCDSMCNIIIQTDGENFAALGLMASAKRFENQPDSSIAYCDRMINMNSEYTYATCLKARALLKQQKNDEAMQLVKQCILTDSTNAYTLATLALTYHCMHDAGKRDAVLQNAERRNSDSSNAGVFQYVHDVINNKETL